MVLSILHGLSPTKPALCAKEELKSGRVHDLGRSHGLGFILTVSMCGGQKLRQTEVTLLRRRGCQTVQARDLKDQWWSEVLWG